MYSTPEGSSGRLELKDTTGARGAGDVMDQPIETYASAPRVSRDLRHRKAQVACPLPILPANNCAGDCVELFASCNAVLTAFPLLGAVFPASSGTPGSLSG